MDISLSNESQEFLISTQRVIFVLTSFLNALSMYCLLKKTPPNQVGVRAYLLHIQVLVILSSVYLDVLYTPIPLFPAPAGYCVGPLCRVGVPPHSAMGVFVLLTVLVCTSVISCSLYRHQSVIPARSRFRVSEKTCTAVQVLLTSITSAGPIIYTAYPFRQGPIVLILLFVEVIALLYGHMFSALRAESKRSQTSTERVRLSLIVLLVQLSAPVAFIVIPGSLLFTSMIFDRLPFAVTLPIYRCLTLHPLVHNIVLLSATPPYRRFCSTLVRRTPQKVGISANSNGTLN